MQDLAGQMTIPEITQKHLKGKTLAEFAQCLGVEVTPQSVHHWKEGNRIPEIMFLFRVIGSESATHEAKEWARECLNILRTAAGVELENTLDGEIERRR